MSVTGRFVQALNPVAVFGLIARIPLAYMTLLIVIAALWYAPVMAVSALGIEGVLVGAGGLALAMYLWLAMLVHDPADARDHRERGR